MSRIETPCKSEESTHTAPSMLASSYAGFSSILLKELGQLARAAITARTNRNSRALPVAMSQVSFRLSKPTISNSGIDLVAQTNLGPESCRLASRQPEALTCARTALASVMQLLATQMQLMVSTANMQGSGIPTLALASGMYTASEVLRDLPALLLTSAEAMWEAGDQQRPGELLTSALSAAIEIGNARWPNERDWSVGRAVLRGLQNGAARI